MRVRINPHVQHTLYTNRATAKYKKVRRVKVRVRVRAKGWG